MSSPTPPTAAPDALAERSPEVAALVNAEHPDAVLLVGRVLGARPGATAARVAGLDATGADLVVSDGEGDHEVRLAFAQPVADADLLTAELMGLVLRARAESGEPGMTGAERQLQALAGLRTFVTSVVAVADVHPRLRRITFGGGDLVGFQPLGPDTFLHVLLPPPGRTELTVDQGFTWEAYARTPEAERPVGAYYTVHRWRPERAEVDLLFVLHGGHGHQPGPASAWAARARPGDPAALWGPRTGWDPPAGTDRHLLVADETGLPAVATILEALPPGTPVRAVVEVGDEGEHLDLPSGPGIEVTWLHRRGAAPGTTTLLPDAVRALPGLGQGATYAWGGGESRTMTAIRTHLRQEVGLPRQAVSLVAYWRLAPASPTAPSEPA